VIRGLGKGCARDVVGTIAMLSVIGAGSATAKEADRCAMWIDLYAGEPVAYEQLVADLSQVRVVYLGEKHTLARHHEIQESILADLVEQGPLVLGLEQLTYEQQAGVDRYNAGEIGFEELAEEIGWSETWPRYEQYRGLVSRAREVGAPVIGLNADPAVIRAVGRNGLEKVEPDVRAKLPLHMQVDDPMYRRHLKNVLSVHAHASSSPEMIDLMLQAQVARDETMAKTLVEYLSSEAGEDRRAVVVAGSGHVEHSMGIPSRVRRRMPGVDDRLVVMSDSGDVQLSDAEMMAVNEDFTITHADLRHLDEPLADYLHIIEARAPNSPGKAPEEGGGEKEQE